MSKILAERLSEPAGFGGRKSPFQDSELEASIAKHNRENPMTADEAREKIARFKKAKTK